MNLRDHDQPCEHTDGGWMDDSAYIDVHGTFWMCEVEGCPGGREVTINYEAALRVALRNGGHVAIVDAALGGNE